jgi:magnesium chelatase family protein
MLAIVPSATLLGASGRAVSVEVHVSQGLPAFSIVGLPDEACRESRDRVRAAVMSSGLTWPQRRITVNLAPSGVRKGGAGLDLAIAIGVLVASEALTSVQVAGYAFVGELGLDGSVRRVPGVVPLVAVLTADAAVVPLDCMGEAELVASGSVRGTTRLAEIVEVLRGKGDWPARRVEHDVGPPPPGPDLQDVRGQPLARYALEVAAAGSHHLLLVGPPGAGKTMLARRLPGLLPPLTPAAALETTLVHSAAGLTLPGTGLITQAPFRAPHHSASPVSMVGGGTAAMRPGEVSLAHHGVLFLDELGEFPMSVLDGLRQPLEDGVVRVTRARASVEFPAQFLLVGATNPCPCGQGGRPGSCSCSETAQARYLRRLSGPLIDRFDLRVNVLRPSVAELVGTGPAESSTSVAGRVLAARRLAEARGVGANAELPGHRLDELAPLTASAQRLLECELERDRLTGRGLHRVRRVARTVADLAGDDGPVGDAAVVTALALRADPRSALGLAA